MSIRLLALDLDGTLLDPYGKLPGTARAAVADAQRAGLAVIVCTGRRFRTALPLLRELELEGPAVVNNGAVVKDLATARTLHHAYLADEVYPEALEVMRSAGAPLVYVDEYEADTDILVERGGRTHPFQVKYLADHGEHCRFVDDLGAPRQHDVIMLSMMADEATLEPLRERAARTLGNRIETHVIWNKNYEGQILEFFSPSSGKWRALERVASDAGIAPEEIAAVGDDSNDASMLRGAGRGSAMGNAVDEAKRAADIVVRSNAEGGVVEAIRRVLLTA
jgi:hypothetical protein